MKETYRESYGKRIETANHQFSTVKVSVFRLNLKGHKKCLIGSAISVTKKIAGRLHPLVEQHEPASGQEQVLHPTSLRQTDLTLHFILIYLNFVGQTTTVIFLINMTSELDL